MRSPPLAIVLALLAAPAAALSAAPAECADAACADLAVHGIDGAYATTSVETFGAEHCAVVEGLVAPGERTLLRFPLATANVGAAALVLGAPRDHPHWFTWSPCHGHYHFDGFAAYRLWTPEAYAQWAGLRAADPERPSGELLAEHPDIADGLATGRKQGFCVIDGAPLVPSPLPPRFLQCGYQGLSPGFVDRYDAWLDGQWIDVTDVAPGEYVLELETNPERRIREMTGANNAVATPVYVA